MYLVQRKNLHVPEGRVFAEVIEQCIHHFFWARRADIDLVRPSASCALCSGGHPVEGSWVIFHRAPALEEDLTCNLFAASNLRKLVYFQEVVVVCLSKASRRQAPEAQPLIPLMSAALVPLASLSQIERTPSGEDGLPADLEDDLKAFGCKLIHQAGILLKQFEFSYFFSDASY